MITPKIQSFMTVLILYILIIFAITLTSFMIMRICKYVKKSRSHGFCVTSIAASNIILYSKPFESDEYKICPIKEGETCLVMKVKYTPNNKWYFVEYGNKSGYVKSRSFIL